MRAEPHIPLFLWVATALVAHALGGGGATKVAEQIEETMDIGDFASQVRAKAKFAGPVEVSFEEAPVDNEEEEEESENPEEAPLDDSEEFDPAEDDPNEDESEAKADEQVDVEEKPEELKEEEEEKEEEKEDPPEEEKEEEKEKEAEKKPELFLAPKPKPKLIPNRRVAVDQHVKDKNQEDNPNAEFAAEHANRVEEETRARITSTDQNALDPTAGQNHAGENPEPGNSNESQVAQSDENDAPDDARLGEAQQRPQGGRTEQARLPAMPRGQRTPVEKSPTAQKAQAAREAKAASDAQEGMTETHSSRNGSWSIAKAQEARAAQKAQKARQARERILARHRKKKKQPLFGYGSAATTERGVRLNLSHKMAHAVIGRDQLDNLKDQVGKRRLSKHRGSWKNIGLERWRGALENYVASVKPGNQTALNTARVPFARYLNQIHQRLHQVFAHGFLGHLEQLPADHPLNNQEMSTHLEIALSREDGRVIKMGVTKSSGVTAFDVGALESVSKAAPYGPPPSSIVSSDGNVYLHWEFHRKRIYACSTYYARPFIIDAGRKSAPPRVDPPRKPNEKEDKKPDERSGALDRNQTPKRRHRPG